MIFKQIKISLKTLLVLIAFFGSLPLFLYAVYLIHALGDSQQKNHENALIERTQSIASNIDEKINASIAFLEGIATSDAAVRSDLRALYTHSLRLNVINEEAVAITLINTNRDVVIFTKRPFGSPQFQGNDQPSINQVFDTGKPAVSALFQSPINQKLLFAVGVPVFQEGKVAFCLQMIYTVDVLKKLIVQQNLPDDWIVWVLDRNHNIMYRSINTQKHVGKAPNPYILKALNSGQSKVFDAVTSEQIPTKASIAPVNNWGLHIAIGVPKASLNQDIQRALSQLAGFCLLLIVVTIALALLLANYLSRHVNDIIESTHANMHGAIKYGPVKEFNRLAKMHDAMRRQHIISHKNIRALHEEKQAISEALIDAKHDALTMLPNRAYFHEQLEELQSALLKNTQQPLAFLFIDLDGFKQVNDAQGHVAGDQVLIKTANVIRQSIRDDDLAARYGGDEFIVCLHLSPHHRQEVLTHIAGRIIQGVNQIGHHIGCSIGVSIWHYPNEHYEAAIQRADDMMYQAKNNGKNQFQLDLSSPSPSSKTSKH